MDSIKNQTPTIELNNQNQFPFKSLKQTLALLDCSKFYVYSLIKKQILTPYYLELNSKGKGTGKVYFKQEEIAKVFQKAIK